MPSFGRQVIGPTQGHPIMVSYDGEPDWKSGGVTLDWATIPSVAADTTLIDGTVIPAGSSGLELGAVLTKITSSGKYGPWSPTMSATTVNGATGIGALTMVLASGANIVPGDVLTIDTAGQQETATVRSVSTNTVTFTAPLTKTHADTVAVTKANDGRQTLTPGEVCVLNMSVVRTNPGILVPGATDHPAVIVGGRVWKDRLKAGGTNQPTIANLVAALPRLLIVEV
jgi:archaellum component FlaF (FlaF/FlaG flagellin family)